MYKRDAPHYSQSEVSRMATMVVFALAGPILLKYIVIISSLDSAMGGVLDSSTVKAVPLQVCERQTEFFSHLKITSSII